MIFSLILTPLTRYEEAIWDWALATRAAAGAIQSVWGGRSGTSHHSEILQPTGEKPSSSAKAGTRELMTSVGRCTSRAAPGRCPRLARRRLLRAYGRVDTFRDHDPTAVTFAIACI